VFQRLIEHLPIITYEEHVRAGQHPEASMIYISPAFRRLTGHTAEPYQTDPPAPQADVRSASPDPGR